MTTIRDLKVEVAKATAEVAVEAESRLRGCPLVPDDEPLVPVELELEFDGGEDDTFCGLVVRPVV